VFRGKGLRGWGFRGLGFQCGAGEGSSTPPSPCKKLSPDCLWEGLRVYWGVGLMVQGSGVGVWVEGLGVRG